ncbi:TPA: hypothetical protein KRE09_003657 [Clostridioides difficile]|uniref:Uncharacterized protein n=1 Tax=Clostridioides difficile TaxID=1496 RepID=A0A069AUB1_CLODI|nr:ribbon-helix-helix domain-containing protein [Clostridioides difficile]MBF8987871.1 hypothetical protein [Clostridioides difficile]MBY1517637.1 ribbon-helix-helix domain-containing protein [Clostridioides difficile]MBY2379534.1 ribbon-helix-helix domain-containing protein [Clostridioides difficile]MCA0615972.1 ribbon-helix-helix domain-containing protein [Clostridioides difficile]MCG7712197.1 ribbon-helix-helix domain-containing protein [Clostridioides difficile]
MATQKPRFTITVDDELLKEIDDFRFDKRFSTRTQATIELIKLGLEKLNTEKCKETKE